MMLRACLGPVLKLRLAARHVTVGLGGGATLFRTTRNVLPQSELPLRYASHGVATSNSLNDILEDWVNDKELGTVQSSDEALTRCLYECLKLAKAQQMKSDQLMLDPHFQRFWSNLIGQIDSMSANTAVMCLYNCAKYNFIPDLAVSTALVNVCNIELYSLQSTSRCILIWSLCKLNIYHDHSNLVDRILELFLSDLMAHRPIKPQSFANVLWTLATTNTWPPAITDSVIDYICRRSLQFDIHTLSIILWSLTKANISLSNQFLEETSQRASALLKTDFKVVSLVHCCWALGTANYYSAPFFSSLTQRLLSEQIDSSFFTSRLLSLVAWSCARTGYYHSDLLDHIAMISLNRLNQFNSQDLGNLGYAYGYLNHHSHHLLIAISDRLSSQQELANNDLACANVANACLIHKYYPQELLKRLMSPDRISALLKSGQGKHLHLLAQIHYLIQTEQPHLTDCMLQPPYDQVVPAMVVAESMLKCQRIYSIFHHNIYKALLQIVGSTEHLTTEALTMFGSFIDAEVILDSDDRAMSIPLSWCGWRQPLKLLSTAYPVNQHPLFWTTIRESACNKKLDTNVNEEVSLASDWRERLDHTSSPVARRIAFEADGPRHYAVNCRHRLGNTEIKHRLLKSQGWNVVDIPYFEWEDLKTDQDHINYIARKMYANLL